MNIIQMQCFCAVAKYNSFSLAADALYMSQPSVSRHVMAFEEECGFPLLLRSGKRFELTAKGRLMLKDCNRLLTYFEDVVKLQESLREKPDSNQSTFALAGNPDMAHYGILASLHRFETLNPQSTVQLIESDDTFCRHSLTNNEVDLAFTSDIDLDPLIFGWQNYLEERLCIAVPYTSPLAQKDNVFLSDLKRQELVTISKKSKLFDFIRKACTSVGFEPNIVMLTSRTSTAFDYMDYHPEAAFIFAKNSFTLYNKERYKVLEITDSPTFQCVLAWRKGSILNEGARQYLKFAAPPAPESFIEEYQKKEAYAQK